jgi:sigma-B regulation protein RsbU (phosphoserine phosphatase)
MNETVFTVAEELNLPYLREIGLDMIHGKKGFLQITSILTHKKCWLSFAPISANGWSVGVVFPQKELMANIHYLDTYITFIGILGILLLFGITTLISMSITKPIIALTKLTKKVAKGNLDIEIPYTNLNDEVGDLARSFEFMKTSLKEYIKNLQETTASKERIQSELNIAAKIQASMLPQTFPPFPDRKEFEIYAIMKPAKEVGGDFYDFFFIDKNKLCFTICDVSGKGVPASLFMAILKYLLKTEATKTKSPADIIKSANKILIPDNKTCMFATGFLGILDTDNGVVEFANAGHLPPILYKNGKASFIKTHENFVIGVLENVEYKNQKIQLENGDILLLYSDGATEAKNSKDNMLTSTVFIEKVEAFLQTNDNIVDLINHLKSEIESFSSGVPQSDDITLLAIKFKGA